MTTAIASPASSFDLSSFRLRQDFAEQAGVKKLLTHVPVRKPHRQEFVRTHPDQSYRFDTALLTSKEDHESFLVAPHMQDMLSTDLVPVRLYMAMTRQKVPFLWPVRLPGYDGKQSAWHLTAMEAAERAQTEWTKVVSNMALGAYEIFVAASELDEPEWPTEPFERLMGLAFAHRIIDRPDHPVCKRLRGES